MPGKALGPPCPTCGRPIPLSKREHLRRFRARHRDDEIGERRRAYASWYYQNVTKPKRMAKATEVGEA